MWPRAFATDQAGALAPAPCATGWPTCAACRWARKHHGIGEHDPAERMVLPRVRTPAGIPERTHMLAIGRAMRPDPPAWPCAWRFTRHAIGRSAGQPARAGRPAAGAAGARQQNGEPRIVPVHPRIAHLVRGDQWPPATTTGRSANTSKPPCAPWARPCRLHDLRHSAASEMINAGVDLYTVAACWSHKSAVSTQRYAHRPQPNWRPPWPPSAPKVPITPAGQGGMKEARADKKALFSLENRALVWLVDVQDSNL